MSRAGDPDQVLVFSSCAAAGTRLAAFDAALAVGNCHNYNLVQLSSIVPPETAVVRQVHSPSEDDYGRLLHAVWAVEYADEVGTEAWAGLAWAVDQFCRGGVFVEAHGRSETAVLRELRTSVEAMMILRPELKFGSVEYEVAGGECLGEPTCALALAVYPRLTGVGS